MPTGSGRATACHARSWSAWPSALAVALIAAFVTVGGRSADLWLRDLLHFSVRPHRLAWRTVAGASPADAPAAAWVEAPLALAWMPAPPAEAAD